MIEEVVGDPRFFAKVGPHTLTAVLAATGAQPHAAAHRQHTRFDGVATLVSATPGQISFLDNRRYSDQLATTRAGAVILHPALADRLRPGIIGLLTDLPYLAWARTCALFYPSPPITGDRHPTAAIDPTADLHPSAEIGPFVVIGPGAVVGAGCRFEPHVVIGPGVVLGVNCAIGSGVTITHALIGDRVRIFPGARIGQDGFGFAPDHGAYVSVPQLGRVIIGDDVEIGANTTIDRGSMRDTVIGAGSRLDNLVQIAHNVRCGEGCVIVAQAGISGSTILEDHVMVAGQAGLTGHLRIGREARIGAQSGVMADIPAGASVMGSPSQPSGQYFRELAILRRQARRHPHHARPADPV